MGNTFTSNQKTQTTAVAVYITVLIWILLFVFESNLFAQKDSLSHIHSQNNLAASNLNQFTGGYSSGFVELKWITSNQSDISHFEIERSTDGTNFRQIGKQLVKADEGKSEYTYLDILADKGANFYRLVLIDKDGNISYSKSITIGVEKGISLFVVYPNPFGKKVMVKFHADKIDQAFMSIIDNDGKVIRSQTNAVQPGDNLIIVQNVDNLPGGIYYLELVTKDKKIRTKLMKQLTD